MSAEMDRARISHHINLVRSESARCLKCAKGMIEAKEIDKACLLVSEDNALLCEWLEKHSDELNQLYSMCEEPVIDLFCFDIVEQIEILRFNMHENYLEIVRIYLPFPDLNSLFCFDFLHLEKKVTASQQNEAERNFRKMTKTIAELDTLLEHLDRALYSCIN